jgi:hypothetical protein
MLQRKQRFHWYVVLVMSLTKGGTRGPGFPFFVPYMVDYLFGGKYRSVWRFNPSTMTGYPRPLHFLAEGASE